MPRQRDPWVSKQLVSRRLRALRDQIGRTQRQVAESMDWSLSKLIRIENATVHISTSDLKALIREYEADDAAASALIDEAKASRQAPWYASYGTVVPPTLARAIAYESAARSIHQFQLQVVPGLVQTEAYARAVLGLFLHGEDLDKAVEVRMERRRRLFDDEPPGLHLVLDESVLLRMVGGVEVVRDQIEHLMTLAEQPWFSIAVMPLARGAYPGLHGSFTLMDLDTDIGVATVLDIEVERGEEYLTNRDDALAQTYWTRFEEIAQAAERDDAAIATLKRNLAQAGSR
jgi:transcriptional regulator with XRE-family HTH domain